MYNEKNGIKLIDSDIREEDYSEYEDDEDLFYKFINSEQSDFEKKTGSKALNPINKDNKNKDSKNNDENKDDECDESEMDYEQPTGTKEPAKDLKNDNSPVKLEEANTEYDDNFQQLFKSLTNKSQKSPNSNVEKKEDIFKNIIGENKILILEDTQEIEASNEHNPDREILLKRKNPVIYTTKGYPSSSFQENFEPYQKREQDEVTEYLKGMSSMTKDHVVSATTSKTTDDSKIDTQIESPTSSYLYNEYRSTKKITSGSEKRKKQFDGDTSNQFINKGHHYKNIYSENSDIMPNDKNESPKSMNESFKTDIFKITSPLPPQNEIISTKAPKINNPKKPVSDSEIEYIPDNKSKNKSSNLIFAPTTQTYDENDYIITNKLIDHSQTSIPNDNIKLPKSRNKTNEPIETDIRFHKISPPSQSENEIISTEIPNKTNIKKQISDSDVANTPYSESRDKSSNSVFIYTTQAYYENPEDADKPIDNLRITKDYNSINTLATVSEYITNTYDKVKNRNADTNTNVSNIPNDKPSNNLLIFATKSYDENSITTNKLKKNSPVMGNYNNYDALNSLTTVSLYTTEAHGENLIDTDKLYNLQIDNNYNVDDAVNVITIVPNYAIETYDENVIKTNELENLPMAHNYDSIDEITTILDYTTKGYDKTLIDINELRKKSLITDIYDYVNAITTVSDYATKTYDENLIDANELRKKLSIADNHDYINAATTVSDFTSKIYDENLIDNDLMEKLPIVDNDNYVDAITTVSDYTTKTYYENLSDVNELREKLPIADSYNYANAITTFSDYTTNTFNENLINTDDLMEKLTIADSYNYADAITTVSDYTTKTHDINLIDTDDMRVKLPIVDHSDYVNAITTDPDNTTNTYDENVIETDYLREKLRIADNDYVNAITAVSHYTTKIYDENLIDTNELREKLQIVDNYDSVNADTTVLDYTAKNYNENLIDTNDLRDKLPIFDNYDYVKTITTISDYTTKPYDENLIDTDVLKEKLPIADNYDYVNKITTVSDYITKTYDENLIDTDDLREKQPIADSYNYANGITTISYYTTNTYDENLITSNELMEKLPIADSYDSVNAITTVSDYTTKTYGEILIDTDDLKEKLPIADNYDYVNAITTVSNYIIKTYDENLIDTNELMEKLSIADSYDSVNAVPFVSTNSKDITNDLIHSNLSNDLNNRQIKYKTELYKFNTVDKGTSTRSTKQQKDNEDKEVKSQYVSTNYEFRNDFREEILNKLSPSNDIKQENQDFTQMGANDFDFQIRSPYVSNHESQYQNYELTSNIRQEVLPNKEDSFQEDNKNRAWNNNEFIFEEENKDNVKSYNGFIKEFYINQVEDTDIIDTEINTYDETNPKGETIFIELPQVQFKEDKPKQEQFDTILEFLYKYSNNPLIITLKNRADGRFNQMNY
ncbi:hypothetical protein CDAR_461871 [Caerostris darwini]|uniref:Uncharacterized protein n=1 Tax=Caerostris darwini TaxID=1538125 RepID=A0AAV4TBC2_9ARAC|nr:hypothetical protein CDAR_461871 [Caerostris darwini]